jgi:signal peptidase
MSTHLHVRPVRRAGRWTVNLAILLVIGFGVLWIAPSLFGFSRYVITGGSMTGTYDKGSVVFEKKTEVADLKVGDVITYLPPASSGLSTLVTHRIVTIEPAQGGGTLYGTKGDHNPSPDPWKFQLLSAQQPVVQASVPHVGWVFIGLAHRSTRMLAIGVPAALIALGALAQLVTAVRDSRKPGENGDETAEETGVPEQRVPRRRIAIPAQRTSPREDVPVTAATGSR